MRALVMGGTEFISLHLLRALQARGHEVTVFNRGRQPDRLPAGVTLIAGDRKDHAGLRERLAGRRFDAVYDVTYAPTLGEDVLLERHRRDGLPVTIVRPTHVMGPLNTRNNETFFMDRIHRGRPVLVPGDGGWLRQFGHVEDLAFAMAAILGNRQAYGQA